jgi:antitoxin component YwqK of YwqJK toxin-antitoxin module
VAPVSAPGPTPDEHDAAGRKTGLWTDADPHGGVMTGEYVDGRRQGTWRHFGADGRLRSEGEFDGGDLHGAWTWYRVTGGLLQRGSFDRGEKHGRWERWSSAGAPLDAGTWDHGRRVKTTR